MIKFKIDFLRDEIFSYLLKKQSSLLKPKSIKMNSKFDEKKVS